VSDKTSFIKRVNQQKSTDKKTVYWIAQLFGWFVYVFLTGLVNHLNDSFNQELLFTLATILFVGIGLSHSLKSIIIKYGWLKKNPFFLIPRVILLCLLFGVLFTLIFGTISDLFFNDSEKILATPSLRSFSLVLNFSFVYLLWLLFYFLFNFFENYRTEEIKNLQLESSKNEIELSNLRSQLNPHFMFNAMNSIRALIEENPAQAKTAITKLSGILRNTLAAGKNKLIPLKEELNFVKDYLSLEEIRYEERLKVALSIASDFDSFLIPPFMVQTLVENAIKHGISKLPQGGELILHIKPQDNNLIITIKNTGKLAPKDSLREGVGIKNTLKRLELIYGNQAKFDIFEENNYVIASLALPLNSNHTSSHGND
jgi:two-component system, LytTR family, sensor kinase